MDSAYAVGPKHGDLMRVVGTGGLHVHGHGVALSNKKTPQTMCYGMLPAGDQPEIMVP